MCFHAAGTNYTAAPFNGWYMGTEIGARNLADSDRYHLLPTIAKRMGLDTRREASLWKDRALLELNVAVLYSYELAGVRMTDHHTASRDFMRFCQNEASQNRKVSAQWSWIVPPMSPSTAPQYSMPMKKQAPSPDFHLQPRAY
jgi:nitric-oxide synthase